MSFPLNKVVNGLFTSMGLQWPEVSQPVGQIEVYDTDGVTVINTRDVNGTSFGDWQRFRQRDDSFVPYVHVAKVNEGHEYEGPKADLIVTTFRVYYIEWTGIGDQDIGSTGLNTNSPDIVAHMRTTALRELVDVAWKDLGTGITLNAEVLHATYNSDMNRWFRRHDAARIACSFDVVTTARELKPEVL